MSFEQSIESSTLPLELYEEIINHLHGDLVALASCALVSRSWLRASSYHLSYQRKFYERNAAELAKLFSSPGCTIIRNGIVCHLRIDGNVGFNAALRNVTDRLDSIRVQLRQLSISNQTFSPDAIRSLLPFRMMIKELYLDMDHFREVNEFVQLLVTFPRLQRLEINWSYAIGDATSVQPDDTISSCERPVMPNLQVLKIVGDLVQPSLHCLSPSSKCGINDMSVRYLRNRDIRRVCGFVKELGPHLENLEIGLRGQDPLDELIALGHHVKLGDFDTLTRLRTLRIELAPPKASLLRTPGCWLLTCIAVFLERLNTPTVEHLQFWFRVNEESLNLNPRSWTSITASMARPCFSHLKTLLFEVEGGSYDRKPVIQKIRLHLSAFEERGILKFAEF